MYGQFVVNLVVVSVTVPGQLGRGARSAQRGLRRAVVDPMGGDGKEDNWTPERMAALAGELGGFRDALSTLRNEVGRPFVDRLSESGKAAVGQIGAVINTINGVRTDMELLAKRQRAYSDMRNRQQQGRGKRP